MALNKNKILGFSAMLLFLVGLALVALGFYQFEDGKYVVVLVGFGFFVLAWAFNALRGRI